MNNNWQQNSNDFYLREVSQLHKILPIGMENHNVFITKDGEEKTTVNTYRVEKIISPHRFFVDRFLV